MNTPLNNTLQRTLLLAVTGASGAVYARSLLKKAAALPGLNVFVIFTETAKQVWETETGEPWPGASEEKEEEEGKAVRKKAAAGQTAGEILGEEREAFRRGKHIPPGKNGITEKDTGLENNIFQDKTQDKTIGQEDSILSEKDLLTEENICREKNIRFGENISGKENICREENLCKKENICREEKEIHFIDNTDFNFPYASGSNRLDCMIVLPCSMGSLGRIAAGMSAGLIGRIADVQLKEKRPLLLVPRETPYNLIHLRNMTALCEAGALIIPASPSFYHRPDNLEILIDSFAERLLEIAGLYPMEKQFRWNP